MTTQERLDHIVFYSLEKSIKSYRTYAQRKLTEQGFNITIDQWMVLKALNDHPDCSQHEIAEVTFKDHASLTRIIELLVKKSYLERKMHSTDRRRFQLTLTAEANKLLSVMQPVIEANRAKALEGFTRQRITDLQEMLSMIINNCQQ
ncbi:MarR family winged helix-turn-helix transcriptional regulator [Rubrolithibacter danxiaensis]|uniref:MarR family winged helix-turn-helix transcriptional regulator n=1 Tax=Rubrolithibacter danxiaensis TaxID=3390805 RepID=UPI003BF8FEF9